MGLGAGVSVSEALSAKKAVPLLAPPRPPPLPAMGRLFSWGVGSGVFWPISATGFSTGQGGI